MAKYVCRNCNYRFSNDDAKVCGFCGMETIEKEKDAKELLEEIEKVLE